MGKRILSPSSINTYVQCPRKWYYQYILRMRTKPSIHLVRGSVAHLALEHLYDILPEVIEENYKPNLKVVVTELLKRHWKEHKDEFDKLDMHEQQIETYFEETQEMLLNHIDLVAQKIDYHMQEHGLDFPEAFRKLTPEREKKYVNEDVGVMGFIDVIENVDGRVRLMDYKTSKRAHISDAYRLQLAIYALLYEIEHGKKPDEVGIYFLKAGEQTLVVDEELIKHGKFMIEQVHMSVDSTNIGDFPMKKSPLCKWSSGQCDFYEYCYEGKPIPDKPVR